MAAVVPPPFPAELPSRRPHGGDRPAGKMADLADEPEVVVDGEHRNAEVCLQTTEIDHLCLD
nr:hypothetical protein [Ciceribacter sp. RN22]